MKRALAVAFALVVGTIAAGVAAATPGLHLPDGFVDLTKPMAGPLEARLAPYLANEANAPTRHHRGTLARWTIMDKPPDPDDPFAAF